MFQRLIQWFKNLFQGLFGKKKTKSSIEENKIDKQPPPPLSDTDLEFLFTELLEGVHQGREQTWALKWLHNLENRVTTARWVEWLNNFGQRLLASTTPNNELASRMVALGELNIGEVGDVAYDIGMQLLTRNQGEAIWEYEGPDASATQQLAGETFPEDLRPQQESIIPGAQENLQEEGEGGEEEEFQTITLDELSIMLEQDSNLRQLMAQQLGIETDDPQVIIQALVTQLEADGQVISDQAES
ncbi:MAG: hypothetical protein QNJ47_09445 [Nostocaceae cyanobacterium]|nr:hypothetical protein [Nostocaceae cyanobacterium]